MSNLLKMILFVLSKYMGPFCISHQDLRNLGMGLATMHGSRRGIGTSSDYAPSIWCLNQ